jgi:predicted PurR-regulated permease PerM
LTAKVYDTGVPTEQGSSIANNDKGWLSRERVEALVLLLATLFAIYLCFRLTEPFLPALTWALALAVVGYPVHRWMQKCIRHPSIAAGITLTIILIVIVVPTVWVGHQIGTQVAESFEAIKEHVESGRWRAMLERHPWIGPIFSWIENQFNLRTELDRFIEPLGKHLPRFVEGTIHFGIQLLITFFFLFYFFRECYQMLAAVRSLLPVSEEEAKEVFKRIAETIHATVYGTLVVVLVQGILGGLMFWWLDLPAPLLWGAVMAVVAIIPVFGAALIWVPATIFLALEGSWEKALVLTAWGGIVVALIDNLLYPVLVGKDLRMHTVSMFIAIIGGLVVFGASGLVLGPLVLAMTLVLLDIWRWRTARGRFYPEELPPRELAKTTKAS